MDVNELKQFEIFNKLNDEEVSLFKEKRSGLLPFDTSLTIGLYSETAFFKA